PAGRLHGADVHGDARRGADGGGDLRGCAPGERPAALARVRRIRGGGALARVVRVLPDGGARRLGRRHGRRARATAPAYPAAGDGFRALAARGAGGAVEPAGASAGPATGLAARAGRSRPGPAGTSTAVSGSPSRVSESRLSRKRLGSGRKVPPFEREHHVAKSGLDEARRAIGMLRDDELPGPERLSTLA